MGKKRKNNQDKNKTNTDNRNRNKTGGNTLDNTAPKTSEPEKNTHKFRNVVQEVSGGKFFLAVLDLGKGWPSKILLAVIAIGLIFGAFKVLHPHPTIINGVTDETVRLLQKQMEADAKEREAALDKFFPRGYIMFTATKAESIIPLNRKPLPYFYVTNWNECKIEYSEQVTMIQIPSIFWQFNEFGAFRVYMENPINIGDQMGIWGLAPNAGINLYVVSTNKDSLTFAFGFHVWDAKPIKQ